MSQQDVVFLKPNLLLPLLILTIFHGNANIFPHDLGMEGNFLSRSASLVTIVIVLVFIFLAVMFGPRIVQDLNSRTNAGAVTPRATVPPNQPGSGLVYDGLTPETEGPCKGLYKIPGTDLCTHGPDPAPPGVNIKTSVPPVKP